MNIKKLITDLQVCADEDILCTACERYGTMGAPECANELLREAAAALEEMQKRISEAEEKGRWIPVRERLPEESGQYIVCCDDSGCPYGEGIWYQSGVVVCAHVDVGISGGICWEWYDGNTLYDLEGVVTHWMPLPQPPKGE